MLEEIEELSATSRRLKINVPSDVITSETQNAYNELRMTTNIPGFRTGKVPEAILRKRFGKNVEAQIIEKVVPQYYMMAIKEANIEPVSYPDINEKIELQPGQPLLFSVTVEIKPDMGDISYDGITLKKKTIDVKDEEIVKALEILQESKALYSVTDDPLQEGDMAIVNGDAFVDDEPKEELSYKEYPFVLGSDEMPREFSDALMGKKNKDTSEVKLSFEADHPNKTIAGKEILFKMSVEEAKKKQIPPIDDELAKEAQCENLEELKGKIRDNLNKRKESQINLEYKKEILDEVANRHNIDVPAAMVQGEIDSIVQQEKDNAARTGAPVKPDEELKKECEEKARDNVKSVLLLEAIGKKENIEVDDADVKSAIDEIAARNAMKPEEVTKLYAVREGSMDALKSRLFADKVLDFILEKATIEE
jgi:trigger factor